MRLIRNTVLFALVIGVSTPALAQARQYHLVAAAGHGKTKVRFAACLSGDQLYERTSVRKSSDSHYPRVTIKIAEGSQHGDEDFSLFPGDLVNANHGGPWSAAATIDVTLRPARGKTKHKHLTVGDVGAC